jgi:hypothetical protein
MFLIDGEDLFEVEAEACYEDPDGTGFWLKLDGEDESSFYEYVEVDLDE